MVILYSLWDIPLGKISKHAQVKHFPNRSAKHARYIPSIFLAPLPLELL